MASLQFRLVWVMLGMHVATEVPPEHADAFRGMMSRLPPQSLRTGPVNVQMLMQELMPESDTYGTWATKNLSALEEFLTLRVEYVVNDEHFQKFRRTVSTGWRSGCDGQYDSLHPDTAKMQSVMESSLWGRAFLESASAHGVPRVDSFGSPIFFHAGRHGYMSPDLFGSLYKLTLLFESFGDFEAVAGQPRLPTYGDVYAGPGMSHLLFDWDVVEVGAGPGLFAASFISMVNARTYSILDLPTQQAMQSKVLVHALGEEKVQESLVFIPCCSKPYQREYILPSYDLFLSHSALAELTVSMRERYFFNFIIKSKRGFIIDNYEDIHSTRKGGISDGEFERKGDGGNFAGLDLVWRLQDLGFDVKIRTHQELLHTVHHRSRAVVITWAATPATEKLIGQLNL